MMTKSLSFLKLQALILSIGLLTVSCSEDDDEEGLNPSASNSVVYDGNTFEIKNGLIEDYGADDPYYNYDFTLSDGSFANEDVKDGTFALYLEMFSAGTSGFKTGSFVFMEEGDDEIESEDEGKSFFTGSSALYIEKNNDGLINEEGDEEIHITGGTVTVSGTGTEYTLVYDLTLENGKTLKGSYAGSFMLTDETEDGEDDETEEEPVAPAGHFMLDNQHHYFTQGVAHSVSSWENDNTGRFHEILLMDDGFQIDDEGNYTGEGLWMNLTLVAQEAGQIEGDYQGYADFGPEDQASNAPDFTWKGLEVLHGDPESEEGYTEVFDSDREQTEMGVIITKTDSGEYEITISGTDNGRSLQLHYVGPLPIF